MYLLVAIFLANLKNSHHVRKHSRDRQRLKIENNSNKEWKQTGEKFSTKYSYKKNCCWKKKHVT